MYLLCQGLGGMYRGYISTILRELPFSLIQYPIWESLKVCLLTSFFCCSFHFFAPRIRDADVGCQNVSNPKAGQSVACVKEAINNLVFSEAYRRLLLIDSIELEPSLRPPFSNRNLCEGDDSSTLRLINSSKSFFPRMRDGEPPWAWCITRIQDLTPCMCSVFGGLVLFIIVELGYSNLISCYSENFIATHSMVRTGCE